MDRREGNADFSLEVDNVCVLGGLYWYDDGSGEAERDGEGVAEGERSGEEVDGETEREEWVEAEGERWSRVKFGGDSSSDEESMTVSVDL